MMSSMENCYGIVHTPLKSLSLLFEFVVGVCTQEWCVVSIGGKGWALACNQINLIFLFYCFVLFVSKRITFQVMQI